MKISKEISRTATEEKEIDLPYYFIWFGSTNKVVSEEKIISVYYSLGRSHISIGTPSIYTEDILMGTPCTEQEFEETKAKVLEVINKEQGVLA